MMLMMTPSFVQACAISYESMTFGEVMRMPSSQRIALLRIREEIRKKFEADMPK